MKFINSILRLLFFWMLFFIIQRNVFLFLNRSGLHDGFQDWWSCNLKGLSMDMSASLYLTGIPIIAAIIGLFINRFEIINKFIKIYSRIFIVVCSVLVMCDAGIYSVWGTKINARAISYLAFPKEVLPTVFSYENILLLILIVVSILFFWWLFNKIFLPLETAPGKLILKISISLFLVGGFIIGIRGGVQKIPINKNRVFYSPNSLLNFGALNGFWNFIDLVFHPINSQNNPYKYFTDAEAKKLVDEMHFTPVDSTVYILNTQRPNVILVLLESWSADVVECVGGEKNVAPKFGELAKEGILFTKFYSTGSRTEQGMLAVLSADPSLPTGSIIHEFGKFDKLPNLYRTFNDLGYHTSYFVGGRLQFDNIEAYLRAAGVKHLIGEDDFEIKKRTFWGAYDDEIYAKQLTDLDKITDPFFSIVSTMITHEWFNADVPKYFTQDDYFVNDNYRNTMHYADSCLFAYIQTCKTKPWYKNTLFILVADHSCEFPKGRNNFAPERHHIPMMILGGALKENRKGKIINQIGSHTDIASTVLAQMKLSSKQFPKSKNLFNPNVNKFACYAFDNGFGLITSTNELVFDHNQLKTVFEKNPSAPDKNKLLNFGKAYLQINFQEYLDYGEMKRN